MSPIWMTVVIFVTLSAFAWSAVRRWRLLMVGTAEPRFTLDADALRQHLERVVVYVFGQRKLPKNSRYRAAGLAHVGIFSAFVVLLLNSVMLWIRGYSPEFDFWGVLDPTQPIGALYSLVKELSAFAAIAGGFVFVYYRVVVRPQRMSLGTEGLLILGIIITMMIADYIYVGGHTVREARALGTGVHWHWAEPFGSALGLWFSGMSDGTVTVLEHVGFWWHATWVLLFLNLLPYSKHFHIITIIPNIFTEPLDAKGKLPDVDDIEGKVERDEPIGIARPEHLTWKHILDLYTCTECGRCSDNCPAFTTGKELSPKHLTLALRDHLYELEPYYLGNAGIESPGYDPAKAAAKTAAAHPWPEGYRHKPEPVDLDRRHRRPGGHLGLHDLPRL